MRWIGIICILVGSTGMGLYQSYLVRLRYDNLKAVKKNLICLRGEIEYGRTPLPEAFAELGQRGRDMTASFFRELSEKMIISDGASLGQMWEETMKKVFPNKSLTEGDRRDWLELGQTIGYLDSEMQINTLNLYMERIQHSLDVQREEKKVKYRLYNILGVMTGAFITIMIL